MAGSFVIHKGRADAFRFNLRAGNHEIILSSETYKTKDSALKGVESVRTNSQDDARFTRKTAKDGSSYFVLTAKNGEVIGKSEMYSSTRGMENGIKSVAANAPGAKLVDKTA